MSITKARLDRMIDMIDSAWLKRRDSENTNSKQFFGSPSVRNPPIAEPPRIAPFTAMARQQRIHGDLQRKIYLANTHGERKMTNSTSERNERFKATMRQKETPLNKGPEQVPCSPNQSSGLKRRPMSR